ncbi:MAG TPA: hypothetical protein VFZ78_08185 [Flavisolibacter sp.]
MKKLIEIILENNTKITLATRHIVFIEPLSNGKTRVTTDVKTSITDSKAFITNEAYADLIKRLEDNA